MQTETHSWGVSRPLIWTKDPRAHPDKFYNISPLSVHTGIFKAVLYHTIPKTEGGLHTHMDG